MTRQRIGFFGELLVASGCITAEELKLGLALQKKEKGLLGEILMRMGFLKAIDLYRVLAKQFGMSYITIKDLEIAPEAIAILPAKFACYYAVMPVKTDGESVTIAISDPLDLHTIDDVRILLKKKIKTVLAIRSDILEAIKKYYGVGADTIERITMDFKGDGPATSLQQQTQDLGDAAEDASIIKFMNQILMEAYNDRATDIHIEPYEDELKIRYRVDGILYDTKVSSTTKNFQAAIISRIKIMANLNISERRLPQDGRIKVRVADREFDLRVSILPTPFGESVVIRLLVSNILLGFEQIGFAPGDLQVLERMIQKPYGIIFVTGPTGSGKTTTLYSCLSRINSHEKKIITIEDPIEYQLKGVTQVQIQPKIGLTFATALRSMLRHDPDVMMVGEVRDYETAEITIRVALTGHLVFSTIHTNNAAGGITRLVDMGIEPFLVASSVECFIAQRLVRVICDQCKVPAEPESEILQGLGLSALPPGVQLYKGKGCPACKSTGYKGRIAIYEMLVMDDAIRELVLKRVSIDQIKRKAVELGMSTLRQDGMEKAFRGITTLYEVLRVTQETDIQE